MPRAQYSKTLFMLMTPEGPCPSGSTPGDISSREPRLFNDLRQHFQPTRDSNLVMPTRSGHPALVGRRDESESSHAGIRWRGAHGDDRPRSTERPQAKILQAEPNRQTKPDQENGLGLSWISSSDSGLFNGLRAIQSKKFNHRVVAAKTGSSKLPADIGQRANPVGEACSWRSGPPLFAGVTWGSGGAISGCESSLSRDLRRHFRPRLAFGLSPADRVPAARLPGKSSASVHGPGPPYGVGSAIPENSPPSRFPALAGSAKVCADRPRANAVNAFSATLCNFPSSIASSRTPATSTRD